MCVCVCVCFGEMLHGVRVYFCFWFSKSIYFGGGLQRFGWRTWKELELERVFVLFSCIRQNVFHALLEVLILCKLSGLWVARVGQAHEGPGFPVHKNHADYTQVVLYMKNNFKLIKFTYTYWQNESLYSGCKKNII